jgi:hypothetical protein
MAEDRTPGRSKLRQRDCIGGGPGRHQKHRRFVLKQLGQSALDPLGRLVVAIAERKSFADAHDGVEDFRRDPGGVVAGKIHPRLLHAADRTTDEQPITVAVGSCSRTSIYDRPVEIAGDNIPGA